MHLSNKSPKETLAWNALHEHYLGMQHVKMQDLFDQDSNRTNEMHIRWKDFLLDYSKNKISTQTLSLLHDFAREMKLNDAIHSMYSGAEINETEQRQVGHVWLRDIDDVYKSEYHIDIKNTLNNIELFTNQILNGDLKGTTQKVFTDVVNIGIGGSDLGSKLVIEALSDYQTPVNVHFISNIDYDSISSKLNRLNPETTLVIVVSKSFSTKETLMNADLIKSWFIRNDMDLSKHLVAITSNPRKAQSYGLTKSYIFPIWDWVGGRFSLWSSVGLSISIGIGFENFKQLLLGAHNSDQHFYNSDFENNIPITLALISIWYSNFFGYETEAVIPYSDRLFSLPAYLQQVVMESNGKNVSKLGTLVDYQTCNIIWGEIGTNSQHAFFQLFHQGTKIIPSDFIGFINPNKPSEMHNYLMANFFAQTEGLMNGKEGKLYKTENRLKDGLHNFKVFRGNRPTNSILIDKLTPKNLGSLLAFYEHKTFVQGYLWNIYSFDQFGVEYGKVLADTIANELQSEKIDKHDASTDFLLKYFLKNQK